ncbi:O-antigen ligase family protein [Ferrovum myxofaciens]|uniref:O-antigen ligase family protein n=1 Tax=Ferrovum myxofaciens TaxID=416213 RepID=UPI0018D2865C|nr:O-antigen ligase family protein [Ferrovum myxofaciens]
MKSFSLASPIRLCIYGMLASLPFAVVGVNFFGYLVLLMVLFSRVWRQALPQLLKNPLSLTALIMLVIVGLGTVYTVGPHHEALNVLNRYHKLLFIPLLMPFFQEEKDRVLGLNVLCGALLINVLLSWTEYLRLSHISDPIYVAGMPSPGDAVFRQHITQGLLFCILVVIASASGWQARGKIRFLYWGMALLAAGNVAFVMVGRTGKAMLPVIALWLLGEWWFSRNRGVVRQEKDVSKIQSNPGPSARFQGRWVLVISVMLVLGSTLWSLMSPSTMLGTVFQEVRQSHQTGADTSQGERVEFWHKGVLLFLKHPWLGSGTGSVLTLTQELAKMETKPVNRLATSNFHDEYLMWAVQFGVPGLVAIVAFFIFYLHGGRQPGLSGQVLRGVGILFAFGCLYNSFLVDFTEGYSIVLLGGLLISL